MKNIPCIIVFCFFCLIVKSQDCTIELGALKGSYEGDCKKGKANGKGFAKGEDTYSGEFKNGYPDGHGKYSWKNGDWYEGYWKKGLMDGKGTMHYVNEKNSDSVKAGFWKKGKYIGQHENAYEIKNRTPTVTSVIFIKNYSGTSDEVTFDCQLINGSKPTITNIDVVNGRFQTQTSYDNLPKTSLTTFRGIVFPFRVRVYYGNDMIDAEIFEAGNWTIQLKIQR